LDKFEVLNKYFQNIESFRGQQEEAINSVLDGQRVLCLMPTGEGKSLIYQVAGLCLGKATIIISPLIALMKQQNNDLANKGLHCLFLSELDYRKQFKELTKMVDGAVPDFIFISPERAANDGYLEFILNHIKEKIGLVVVDEAHCISQWGEGFRPAYKTIPDFVNRIFGWNSWPHILCLTATLNDRDKKQIEKDFGITKTIKSPNLWRKNLNLNLIDLGSGKEDSKDEALERILYKHSGEKILVFVHRKYGSKGTTRTLYKRFSQTYNNCDFFDADISDKEKDRILEGFKDGSIKIVFATSAFGMGVDISDIRLVVHYLISESVEQYYQEVGRAGRDGKPSYGYLLYTKQSKNGRKRLIEGSLCSEKTIRTEYEDRKTKKGAIFNSIKYEDLAEERRTAFALLMEFGSIEILAKGVQSLKCFKASGPKGTLFLEEMYKISKSGLIKIICKKNGISINSLTGKIWELCSKRELVLSSSPPKALFYCIKQDLDDDIVDKIMNDQQEKLEKRMSAFLDFATAIEDGKNAESIVKNGLNIK
jgi:ATP-dependent DNA helicase RecQ